MIFVGHIPHIKKTQPYPAHLPLTLEAAGSWWAHLESPGSHTPAGRTPYCPLPVSRPASSTSLPSLRPSSQAHLLSAHLSLLTWIFQRPSVPGVNHPTSVIHPLPPQTPITSYQPIQVQLWEPSLGQKQFLCISQRGCVVAVIPHIIELTLELTEGADPAFLSFPHLIAHSLESCPWRCSRTPWTVQSMGFSRPGYWSG